MAKKNAAVSATAAGATLTERLKETVDDLQARAGKPNFFPGGINDIQLKIVVEGLGELSVVVKGPDKA